MKLLFKPLLVMLMSFVGLFLFMPSPAYGKESLSDKLGKVSKTAEDVGKVADAAGEIAGVVETIGEDTATAGADDKAVPEKAPVDKLVKKDVPLVDLPPQASIGVLIALFVIGGCSALANFFEAGKSKGIVSSVLKCVNLLALNFSKKAGR